MAAKITTEPTLAAPLPSADLIHFFMQQTKEGFEKNDKRFDEIMNRIDYYASGFVTKEDSADQRRQYDELHRDHTMRIEKLESDRDKQSGAITALKLLVGILTAAATLVGALWWVKG